MSCSPLIFSFVSDSYEETLTLFIYRHRHRHTYTESFAVNMRRTLAFLFQRIIELPIQSVTEGHKFFFPRRQTNKPMTNLRNMFFLELAYTEWMFVFAFLVLSYFFCIRIQIVARRKPKGYCDDVSWKFVYFNTFLRNIKFSQMHITRFTSHLHRINNMLEMWNDDDNDDNEAPHIYVYFYLFKIPLH